MSTNGIMQQMIKTESFNLRYASERISAQLKFAGFLVKQHPGRAEEWQTLISRAETVLERISRDGCTEVLHPAVAEIEQLLAPLSENARNYTIHCVGHAHIDMNWMWSWPETVALTNDTFMTVLQLMKEYPGFIFSQSQASVYAIIEKYNPAMLEEIRRRIKEKRWEVTASHWVENDKNMAGGEALTRHLLYTRQYMKKLFDLDADAVKIDWAPDTFGHAAGTPSYLVQGGVKYAYLHRPGDFTANKATAFWWQGPDQARILVRNDMKNGYNGTISAEIVNGLIDFTQETKSKNHMFVYGVGDHGGGPTRRDLDRIVDMGSWPIFPQVIFSSAGKFFDALEKDAENLPTITGELNMEFTGCYTTQTQIKKANRCSENRLADAELAAALNWKINQTSYPAAELETHWRSCLFNHFHDILPGSGVRATRHYTMGHLQELLAATGMMETLALRRLAGNICTDFNHTAPLSGVALPPYFKTDAFGAGVGIGSGNGSMSTAEQCGQGERPFVIFNPTEHCRTEVIVATVWDNPLPGDQTALKDRKFAVITADGQLQAAQFITSGDQWGHRYVKLAFPITVDGTGYAACTIIETENADAVSDLKLLQPQHHCHYSSHERATRFGGENQFIELEINPRTGAILRLKDKASGREIITPSHQMPLLEYAVERPHHMTAWLIDAAAPPEACRITAIKQEAAGPYLIRIAVEAEIHRSRFTVTYEISAGNPVVNIHVRGSWLEEGDKQQGVPTLRMPFPVNLATPDSISEIPFGAIRRNLSHDEEFPALQWVKVGEDDAADTGGVLLLNDCKYGFSLNGNILRASLIRSSYDPDPFPELGEHEFSFGLMPFGEKLSNAQAARRGKDFNHRLNIVGTDRHGGTLPATGSFIRLTAENVAISGLKKAETDDALIVRMYETDGISGSVTLLFDQCLGKIAKAENVDLLERHQPTAMPVRQVNDHTLKLEINPHAIVSLKVYFA